LQVEEPAVDLAVALALVSSVRDQAMPADMALVGEVGLSGEVRSVGQLESRLNEAARLGFSKAIIPRRLGRSEFTPPKGLEILQVRSVREAIEEPSQRQPLWENPVWNQTV
jgi:DNA repair protein RadA/Sms